MSIVTSFVREKEHLDFVGSVEWLACKAGITLNYIDAIGGEDRRRMAKLQDAVDDAVRWYHKRLMTAGRRVPTCARGVSTGKWWNTSKSGGRPTTGTPWPKPSVYRTKT